MWIKRTYSMSNAGSSHFKVKKKKRKKLFPEDADSQLPRGSGFVFLPMSLV